MALLAVLWVLTLLALMAATFTRTSRTEVNLARNAMERFQAEALADAGIHLAVARLRQPIAQGGWSIDGRVRSLQLEDGEVRILIADEAGKIDLNGAGVELLQALFRALGYDSAESATLADAIMDFRDGDHLPLLNGAEDERYLAAGLAHDAKDAPFEDVAELQQVLGMTPELFRRVAPVMTVHTRRRQPNEATAPPLVVAALRDQTPAEGEAGADEDAPLDQSAEPGAILDGAEGGIAAGEDGETGGLRSRLALYAIHAEGRTVGGAVFARDAVVHLTRGRAATFRILSWRQGRRRLFQAASPDVPPAQDGE
jgi:general secretion pathway protein K